MVRLGRGRSSVIWAVVVFVGCLARVVWAVEGSVDVSFQSKYIWRGMVLGDKPVLQPSLSLSDKGLTAQIWFNLDLTDTNGFRNQVNEIDYWLSYTLESDDLDCTFTAYHYSFPHSPDPSTQEVWIGATYKTFLNPSLTLIRDTNSVRGWYVLFTASQELGLLKTGDSEGITLSLNLGYGDNEYCRGYFPDSGRDHLIDYGVRLDWPVPLGQGGLNFNLQYTDFIGRELRFLEQQIRANLVAGVTYSMSF